MEKNRKNNESDFKENQELFHYRVVCNIRKKNDRNYLLTNKRKIMERWRECLVDATNLYITMVELKSSLKKTEVR